MGTLIGMIAMFFVLNTDRHNDNENFIGNSIDFRYVGKIPVISVMFNGKHVDFIVDTGASVSILNSYDMDEYGFTRGDELSMNLNGLGGDTQVMSLAANTNLIINGKRIWPRFMINDISNVVNHLEKQNDSDNDVIGILGSDICSRYGFIIDYYNKKIYLSKYNKVKVVSRNDK